MIIVTAMSCLVIILLSLWIGYSLGKKRAQIDPRHDCIMAIFNLVLLKKLEEKDYDTVKGGIKMRARQYVMGYRQYANTLSKRQLKKIKETITGYELLETAEQLCGPLIGPAQIDNAEINRSLGISE